MMRALAAALFLAGLLASDPVAAASRCLPPVGTLVYQVLNDGVPVGMVRIALDGAGGGRRIRSSVDVELTVLAVLKLRYQHQSEELWRDGAFHSFHGRTEDLGKRYEVAIEARDGDIEMTRNGAAKAAAGPLMSWVVWCEAALREARVVDPLKGKLKGISASFLGAERIELAGRQVVGRRYRVTRKESTGEVWYGPDGIVAMARFSTVIGTTGTVVLIENSTVTSVTQKPG